MSTPPHTPPTSTLQGDTVGELIASGAQWLQSAGIAFGHGTTNADDEAAWLVLWRLGLPLDAPLDLTKIL